MTALRPFAALLVALALLGGAVSLSDSDVEAATQVTLDLQRVTDILIDATPGTPHPVQVTLTHVSGPDATVALWVQAPQGWATSPIETIQLPSGSTVSHAFTFTAEEAQRHNNVTFHAAAIGTPSNQPLSWWLVRTPVGIEVDFDPLPSTVGGIRGTLTVTWPDGSPVVDQPVWLSQTPLLGIGSMTLPGSLVEGRTDGDGVFAFDFGIGWTARAPGEHVYWTGTLYGNWDHLHRGTFHVALF